jgi:hypothetical protein
VDGDRIEVGPGTYGEALDFSGRDVHVYSTGGVEATVIGPPPGVPAISFVHQEGPGARLSGFTITGADTSAIPGEPLGGGIQVSDACPTLTDLRIEGNRAQRGGGIRIENDAHPLLQRLVVTSNIAEGDGGGIYLEGSSPTLIDVELRDNSVVTGSGGGLGLGPGSYPRLHRVLVEGNVAAVDGGGIHLLGKGDEGLPVDASLSQVTLAGNRCDLAGGGGHGANLFLGSDTRAAVVNSIVADGVGGAGIYTQDWTPANPSLQVTYSTLWNNAAGEVVSGTHGELTGVAGDVGNLTEDPRFADPDSDDYELGEGSPCVDTGDPSVEDPDGSPADMGAYGGPWEVAHDTGDCAAEDGDPGDAGDDDDSAEVVYKKCVCSAGGSPQPPLELATLALLVLARRGRRRSPGRASALGGASRSV